MQPSQGLLPNPPKRSLQHHQHLNTWLTGDNYTWILVGTFRSVFLTDRGTDCFLIMFAYHSYYAFFSFLAPFMPFLERLYAPSLHILLKSPGQLSSSPPSSQYLVVQGCDLLLVGC